MRTAPDSRARLSGYFRRLPNEFPLTMSSAAAILHSGSKPGTYRAATLRKDHVVGPVRRRYRTPMSELSNITRGPDGWTVRIVRNGQQHSKYFRFSNGGIRKALARAQRWRNQKLREFGQRQWRSGPRKKAANNTSGTTGVSRNVYGRWVATWQQDGVQRFKTFRTKTEALTHRKAKVQPSR